MLKYGEQVMRSLQAGQKTTKQIAAETGITYSATAKTLEALYARRQVERQLRPRQGEPMIWRAAK